MRHAGEFYDALVIKHGVCRWERRRIFMFCSCRGDKRAPASQIIIDLLILKPRVRRRNTMFSTSQVTAQTSSSSAILISRLCIACYRFCSLIIRAWWMRQRSFALLKFILCFHCYQRGRNRCNGAHQHTVKRKRKCNNSHRCRCRRFMSRFYVLFGDVRANLAIDPNVRRSVLAPFDKLRKVSDSDCYLDEKTFSTSRSIPVRSCGSFD